MVTPPAVGYIGLGQMGSAMVARLLDAGVRVGVCDLDPDPVDRAARRGAEAFATPAELAAAFDVISICVPAAPHVEAVLTGTDGIATAARADQILFVHSTIAPADIRRFHEAARRWGAWLHDACVAGGPQAAASGELVVLAGGTDLLGDGGRAVLDTYASLVVDAGPVGSGAALKLAVNVMTYAQFAAAAVAYDIARHAGADTAALVATWEHTGQLGDLTAQFLPLLDIAPEHITGDFRTSLEGTVDIATKDLALATAASADPDGVLAGVLGALEASMGAVFGTATTDAATAGATTTGATTTGVGAETAAPVGTGRRSPDGRGAS